MVHDPEKLRAFEEAAKADWLSRLTVEAAFRLAGEMDDFSRAMAPGAFVIPSDLRCDERIARLSALSAAFSKVRTPAG